MKKQYKEWGRDIQFGFEKLKDDEKDLDLKKVFNQLASFSRLGNLGSRIYLPFKRFVQRIVSYGRS